MHKLAFLDDEADDRPRKQGNGKKNSGNFDREKKIRHVEKNRRHTNENLVGQYRDGYFDDPEEA